MTNRRREMPYTDYLQTAHWRETRKRKLMAVGCKCERCNNYRNLEVHHLTYDRLGDERMDDLEVLCPDCHRKAHGAAWPGGDPGSPRTGANGEKVK